MTPAMPTGVSSPSQMRQSSPGIAEPPPADAHGPLHAVEGLDHFAGARPAHPKASAGQEREIVGMRGLAQLEHDVVGPRRPRC